MAFVWILWISWTFELVVQPIIGVQYVRCECMREKCRVFNDLLERKFFVLLIQYKDLLSLEHKYLVW
jgi:hypothetical protein